MASPLVALRYATRFRCTADACEDTCCAGLKVPIEKAAYDRVREALGESPEDRAAFALNVLREPDEDASANAYARIRPAADGHCGFMKNKLCGLHQRFGEAVLPDVCSSFPRATTQQDDRVVITTSLACPESARLCLLSDDAPDVVDAPSGFLTRVPVHPERAPAPVAEALRMAARTVHEVRDVPLSSQLLTLAQLAMRTDPDELGRLATPESVRGVHAHFRALVFPWPKVAKLLLTALHTRSQYASQPRYEAWSRQLNDRLQAAGADTPEQVFELYREAREALDGTFPDRLARCFRNYAHYQWARFPVADAPSPVAYVCRLSLRIALLRFGLALTAVNSPTGEALDAAAVETFQLLAKHVEQHPTFRELIESVLAGSDEERFGKTLLFATFA